MNAIYEGIETLAVLDTDTDGSLEVTRIPVTYNSLAGQFVHLWNDYQEGKKPTSGSWLVEQHYTETKPLDTTVITHEYVALHYPYDKAYGVCLTTRLRSQVCTEDEYQVWQASLNPATREISLARM